MRDPRTGLTSRTRLARAAAPVSALLLGVAAFALLDWVPFGGDVHRNARGGEHELGLWQLLIAGEVVVWAVLAAVGWAVLRDLRDRVPSHSSRRKRGIGARPESLATSGNLRRTLSAELELGGDARKNLEGLVAVFSPLIGALLSRFGGL